MDDQDYRSVDDLHDSNGPSVDDLGDLHDQPVIDRGDADDPSVIELGNSDDIPVIDWPEVCYNSKGVEDAARDQTPWQFHDPVHDSTWVPAGSVEIWL